MERRQGGYYVRPLGELWEMWKPRVKANGWPFPYARYEDVERVMVSLRSYDRDEWATAFSAVAKPVRGEGHRGGEERGGEVREGELPSCLPVPLLGPVPHHQLRGEESRVQEVAGDVPESRALLRRARRESGDSVQRQTGRRQHRSRIPQNTQGRFGALPSNLELGRHRRLQGGAPQRLRTEERDCDSRDRRSGRGRLAAQGF